MNSVTEIAKIAHEANKAYCETLGDFSQDHWNCCDQWQRDTVMNGVRAIEKRIVTEPEQSHENWLKLKEEEGWVYGKKKNSNKALGALTHPYMLPFKELTHAQQMKDFLFFSIVVTLLGKINKIDLV